MKRSKQDLSESLARKGLNHNLLRIASTVADAETITFGPHVFEADVRSTPHITAGRIRIALFAAASLVAATGTLTLAENVATGETVTIGSQTYTFRTALTASTTANEVLIGATASDSLDNLIAAVTAGTGGGVKYGSATTANALATAAAGAGDTMTVTALVKGASGNSIATTETLAGSGNQFAAATLGSGADTSATHAADAIVTAINASGTGLYATKLSANAVLVEDRSTSGEQAKACTETLAGSNNAWASATSYGGQRFEGIPNQAVAHRTVNATEVALGFVAIPLSFVPRFFIIQARTSAGAVKAFTGATTINGRSLLITDGGGTSLAAGDTVTAFISE